MSATTSARRIIKLPDCRPRKACGTAIPVAYAKEKAPRKFRRAGRQPVFVQLGSGAVQLASCGTTRETLSNGAKRRALDAWRRDKGAK